MSKIPPYHVFDANGACIYCDYTDPKRTLAPALGSLPVSSAEALCLKWEEAAVPLKNKKVRNAACWPLVAQATAQAEIYEACAAELRRQAGLPSRRQPEENAEMCNARPKTRKL